MSYEFPKIYQEPKVYLVSKPSIDWDVVAEFLADENLPDIHQTIRAGDDESVAISEIAARLCYMSYGKGRTNISAFINNLLSSKDGSVFEHINYGFVITGVSRSLTHELVRHRAGFAFSQRSQRYVDESNPNFVMPPAIAKGSTDAKLGFALSMKIVAERYKNTVEIMQKDLDKTHFESNTDYRKAIRQVARSVLPNATETKIFVTANVRAWRHFIEMRGSKNADAEIRRLAIKILDKLRSEAPLLFGDFDKVVLPDGSVISAPKYSKI